MLAKSLLNKILRIPPSFESPVFVRLFSRDDRLLMRVRSDSSTLEKPRESVVAWCGVGSVLRQRIQGLGVQYEDGDVLR